MASDDLLRDLSDGLFRMGGKRVVAPVTHLPGARVAITRGEAFRIPGQRVTLLLAAHPYVDDERMTYVIRFFADRATGHDQIPAQLDLIEPADVDEILAVVLELCGGNPVAAFADWGDETETDHWIETHFAQPDT